MATTLPHKGGGRIGRRRLVGLLRDDEAHNLGVSGAVLVLALPQPEHLFAVLGGLLRGPHGLQISDQGQRPPFSAQSVWRAASKTLKATPPRRLSWLMWL